MHTLARLDQFPDTLLFSLWQEVEVRGQRTSLCHSLIFFIVSSLHQVELDSVRLGQSVWTAAGIGLQVQKLRQPGPTQRAERVWSL